MLKNVLYAFLIFLELCVFCLLLLSVLGMLFSCLFSPLLHIPPDEPSLCALAPSTPPHCDWAATENSFPSVLCMQALVPVCTVLVAVSQYLLLSLGKLWAVQYWVVQFNVNHICFCFLFFWTYQITFPLTSFYLLVSYDDHLLLNNLSQVTNLNAAISPRQKHF